MKYLMDEREIQRACFQRPRLNINNKMEWIWMLCICSVAKGHAACFFSRLDVLSAFALYAWD